MVLHGWSRGSFKRVVAERKPASASLDPITPNPLVCPRPSPPSLSSFDSLPYGATATVGDQDNCSYESTKKEPVPCFSTVIATIAASGLGYRLLPPSTPNMYGRSTAGGIARSVFPSLCSLQENLQLPFFLSMPTLPVGGTAIAAMVCHGGVHHRVEEMGGNGWPSDLE